MILLRSITVWLVIIAAETIHGILRNLLLAPMIGDLRSRQIGVFIGSLIILAVAYAFICWLRAITTRNLVLIGIFWAVLTVSFEVGLGKLIGLSNERILEDYDLPNGGFMSLGLLFLALTPLIASKLRKCEPLQ